MRILFTNPAPIIKYGMQPGFAKQGWETARIEVPEQSVEGLLKKVEAFRPDFIFTEGGVNFRHFVFPVLERTGIPHIFWAVEDPVGNDGLAMEWAARSVLSLTPCVETLDNYHRHGHRAICVPFAMDPDYYYRRPGGKYAALDAVHIGNNYDVFEARRRAYRYIIQPFIDAGKKIEVYGWDWDNPRHSFNVPAPYYKGYMAHEETVVAYSSAKIVLGVHSIVDSATMQPMRTFEVLGCGGFFLTQRTKAIETMFRNHEHLVWSGSYEETVELMNYYLARDDARERVAANGLRLVIERHTYRHRVADIMRALGMEPPYP